MKRSRTFLQEIPFICSMPAIIWQIFFMVIPVLVIIYFSFVGKQSIITFDHYRALFKLPYFFIIGRSLLLSLLTAITTLCIAYPVAYFIAIKVRRYKSILLFFLTLPFWVNFLVQIYAWYFLLEYRGIINTLLLKIGLITVPLQLSNSLISVFIVMVYCYVPFMIMPLYNILEKLDSRLLDASSDLGATSWQTFMNVTFPLSVP